MITKMHYYFMLNFSPWPLISSIMSFNLLFSLLIFFKNSYIFCFINSILLICFSSFFWWMIYSKEFNFEGKSSLMLENGLKFSMILFISSEVFFFFSFFWSYFHFFLSPTLEIGLSWPPNLVEGFNFMNVPLINTLILMSSGLTITMSHYFLIINKNFLSNLFLLITVTLGLLFSLLQVLEYTSSFFSISDSSFGTSFFILTGFHGIHVVIGTTFLFIILISSMFLSSSFKSFLSFEMSSWYWHFVDVVWIFLYFFLYYMTN